MFEPPRTALAFLTRLPGGSHPEGQEGITASVPWFGVIGLVVGGIGSAVYVGASELVNPISAATLAFVVTGLVTGGFHEDGLADSFDALAGGWTPQRRLEILKDSRHGTFGVMSLVLITILKISALAPLTGWDAVLGLTAAHCIGRSAAVAVMGVAPVASADGLGADYTRTLPKLSSAIGALVGVAAAVVAFGAWAPAILAAVAIGATAVVLWAKAKIGGVTGDLLGAVEQVGEAIVLLGAGAILLHT